MKNLTIDESTAASARLSARLRLQDMRAAADAAEALRPFAGRYVTRRILPDLTAAVKAAWPEITNVYIDETMSGLLYLCITPRLAYTRRQSIPIGRKGTPDAPDRRLSLTELDRFITTRRTEAEQLTAALAEFDANCEQWNRAIEFAATLHESLRRVLYGSESYRASKIVQLY